MFWETATGERMQSPIKMYIEWKKWKESKKYGFYMYDADLGWEIEMPLKDFIVIDEAYQLKGYNNKTKTFMKSNIVSNKKTEEFVVMDDWVESFRGIYDPEMKPQWATLYRILTVNADWVLVRLTLKPSAWKEYINLFVKETDKKWAVTEWLDYSTRYKFNIKITGSDKRESSFGDYEVPLFELWKNVTEAQIADTTILKDAFKEYLDSFKKNDDAEEESLEGSK